MTMPVADGDDMLFQFDKPMVIDDWETVNDRVMGVSQTVV